MGKLELISTGGSFNNYYKSLNNNYHKVFNKYLMLHYPLFDKKEESLEQRQMNLTDHCVSYLGNLENKRILEIGCGNGIQSLYISDTFKPAEVIGIDLNAHNIELAQSLAKHGKNVTFFVDDAHELATISDGSVDAVICIESAFHYPEKERFLAQVGRVLKADGEFVIADLLSKKFKKRPLIGRWKKKMYYYHWTLEQYMESFERSSLVIEKTSNITPRIIKGYKGYLRWITIADVKSRLIRYIALQIFMLIQVNLNLILLRRRRQYMIFKGRKAA